MIEKLKTPKHINWDDTPEGLIQRHRLITDAYEKINELVDAVNELQKNSTISKMEKIETPAENVQDKFAEQYKWIGKLCWFSNGDGFDEVGYLTEIDPKMPEAKFRCNCHDYYKECKPVKPDDNIIYKKEQQ